MSRSLPPPADLLSQLDANPKLICYDWEITQARLSHWRNLDQLARIIAGTTLVASNALGQHWLQVIGPKLGNTVTEITADSPSEWSLVRKSHIGFTGVELVALTRWLESSAFPKLTIELPPDRTLASAAKPPPPAGHAPATPGQKPQGR